MKIDPNLGTIGIARVNRPGSNYGWYWVTDYGSAADNLNQPLLPRHRHHRLQRRNARFNLRLHRRLQHLRLR